MTLKKEPSGLYYITNKDKITVTTTLRDALEYITK